ncbi:hypothetical protein QP157_17200 [Sphingomonas sp. LR61]|uniref:hypothetical protein n=1 Tax=Sphingomonas sp. LR61 TaxID=3050234 RepID=UPI002FDFDC7E
MHERPADHPEHEVQPDDVRSASEPRGGQREVEPLTVVRRLRRKLERRASRREVHAAAVREHCPNVLHTVVEGALPRPRLTSEECPRVDVRNEIELDVEVAPPVQLVGREDGAVRTDRADRRCRAEPLEE